MLYRGLTLAYLRITYRQALQNFYLIVCLGIECHLLLARIRLVVKFSLYREMIFTVSQHGAPDHRSSRFTLTPRN